jgi:biotin carboxylase
MRLFHERREEMEGLGWEVIPADASSSIGPDALGLPTPDRDDYADALLDASVELRVDAVVVANDAEAQRLQSEIERFRSRGVALVMCHMGESPLDKAGVYEEMGVPHVVADTRDELMMTSVVMMASHGEREVIVKPSLASGSRGMRRIFRGIGVEEIAGRASARMPLMAIPHFYPIDLGGEHVVTRVFGGPHFTTGVLARRGEVELCVPLRKTGPDLAGSVSSVELDLSPDVIGYAKRLCNRLQLHGVFGFESAYLEGRLHLYDFNPRVSLDMGYYPALGFSMIEQATRLLRGEPIGVTQSDIERHDGVIMARTARRVK